MVFGEVVAGAEFDGVGDGEVGLDFGEEVALVREGLVVEGDAGGEVGGLVEGGVGFLEEELEGFEVEEEFGVDLGEGEQVGGFVVDAGGGFEVVRGRAGAWAWGVQGGEREEKAEKKDGEDGGAHFK